MTTDVLSTLVAQFTDPFACLRELIQNALDAGSDVVEVNAVDDGGKFVLEVQDHGSGMDRATIDNQLTKLFSSSKDGDLTKIGKFGIGFVSVFALDPVAVCVDTARAGERWRVVFGKDRSFTRVKLDDAIEGTRVRLFLDAATVDKHGGWDAVVERARSTVKHWCRHVENEILFDGVAINETLRLDGHALTVEKDDGHGTVVVAGVGGPAQLGGGVVVGFYNKGLTLLEATSWSDVPPGVSVRISSRWLEHTLTRDSVVRDDRYWKAMKLVKEVVDETLLPRALDALEQGVADDAHRRALLLWLSQRKPEKSWRKRKLFRAAGNQKLTPNDVAAGDVLVAWANSADVRVDQRAFAERAAAAGHKVVVVDVLHGDAELQALRTLGGLGKTHLPALRDRLFVADVVDGTAGARAARLGEAARALLDAAGLLPKKKLALRRLTPSPGAQRLRFARVDGDDVAGVLDVVDEAGANAIVVDVDHEDVDALVALAGRDTALAAFLLAKMLVPPPLAADKDLRLAEAAWKLREAA